jgi:glycosyltransferase involved in cell wall biosynthesis
MRVCFISYEYPPRSLGGAGTYARLLVEGLKKRGLDTYTITVGEKTDRDQKIYRLPVRDTTYVRRLFFISLALSLIDNLNRKHNFDVVHFNEPHIVTRSPKLPMVCTFHSTQLHDLVMALQARSLENVESIRDVLLKNPVGYLSDIITCRMSDKIIGPCPDLISLLKYCFVDKKKINIVPNGIDPEMFDKITCDATFLGKYTLDKESFVLYIGRLYSLKGIQYLIRAFQNLKKEYRKLKLVIAGTGDFEPYLRKIAEDSKDILFVGYVGSMMFKKLLYENCLAVVVPSIYETFPMVVLEAMVCSKPVIASNTGGIPIMVKHGENGFLVKPRDVGGIETSIRRLYEDLELRKKMGIFGRRLVEEEFSVDRMVNGTLKVYESLL